VLPFPERAAAAPRGLRRVELDAMQLSGANLARDPSPRGGSARAIALRTTCILLLLSLALGCDAEVARLTADESSEWAALQDQRASLVRLRSELAEWRRELAATPERDAGAATDPAPRVAAREAEVARLSAVFGERLVAFVAALDARLGAAAPPAERAAALRLKSDEDVEVAEEWIERGGDYRRAIEILETQRRHDPGYPRLEQALARAHAERYVTAERFARVAKGMGQAEVRAVLGPVNLRLMRAYPEQGVEVWLYPKRGGGAAGVFFRREGEGLPPVVYATSFEAHSEADTGPPPARLPLSPVG
jgi:hypothetical protein